MLGPVRGNFDQHTKVKILWRIGVPAIFKSRLALDREDRYGQRVGNSCKLSV